jgi:hypothetical protein
VLAPGEPDGPRAVAEQRARLVEWLERRSPEPVEVVETHVSILAFQADRVFKCKKAVVFGFVDLSTRARRLANCRREVRLNRRFAPDVYLGVAAVTDRHGRVVDHAVEMRRLDPRRRLGTLVAAGGGAATARCLTRVAGLLAGVHARARRAPEIDAVATGAGLEDLWRRELEEVEPFVGAVLDTARSADVARLAGRYIAGRGALFDARIASGRVCDGHGDLLADDIYCLADGPRVLDCLEFDDRLRWGDACADVAFLAMDLERLGATGESEAFLAAYRAAAGDDWPDSLADFYVAYRAHVRAKVACLRHAQGAAGAAETARDLLRLAHRHLVTGRVRLVLVGGVPGAGKSTLARSLAAATGWELLRSDVVRKELAGADPRQPAHAPIDEGLYAPAWTARTYDELLRRAAELLARGCSVVVDASWSDAALRRAAERVAATSVADLDAVVCRAPLEVAMARVAARTGDPSDATPPVARAIAARFAPWPAAHEVDTASSRGAAVDGALRALAPVPRRRRALLHDA